VQVDAGCPLPAQPRDPHRTIARLRANRYYLLAKEVFPQIGGREKRNCEGAL